MNCLVVREQGVREGKPPCNPGAGEDWENTPAAGAGGPEDGACCFQGGPAWNQGKSWHVQIAGWEGVPEEEQPGRGLQVETTSSGRGGCGTEGSGYDLGV